MRIGLLLGGFDLVLVLNTFLETVDQLERFSKSQTKDRRV